MGQQSIVSLDGCVKPTEEFAQWVVLYGVISGQEHAAPRSFR